ncbi:rod shape-determining protein MreC [Hydrogenimonas sp.]
MIRRKVFLFLIALGATGLILYSPAIRTFFLSFSQAFQSFFIDSKVAIEKSIERHISQAERIDRLREQIRQLEHRFLRYRSDAENFKAISSALGLSKDFNTTFKVAHARGYVKLGNFQQLWLDKFKDYDPRINYGVIRDKMAIGIVVEKMQRPLMILAGDKECNFAVYVGDKRAPGIATGLDARHMIVKYIPEWMPLNIGDKVLTSGLDHIFPAGIPVGRVLSVRKMQGFKNARIELFGDTLHPEFVWLSAP